MRLIPQDIIDEALETAREARRGAVRDPHERIRKICDCFAYYRITPEDLGDYLGVSIEKASTVQLEDLELVYNAIRSGEATWSDYAKKDDPEDTHKNTTKAAQDLKDRLQGAKTAAPLSNPE